MSQVHNCIWTEFDSTNEDDGNMNSDSSLVFLALVTFISTDKPELLYKVFTSSMLTLHGVIYMNTCSSLFSETCFRGFT